MILSCMVNGEVGYIVGYAQGRKGKVQVIVLLEGELKQFGLKDIQFADLPEERAASVPRMEPEMLAHSKNKG